MPASRHRDGRRHAKHRRRGCAQPQCAHSPYHAPGQSEQRRRPAVAEASPVAAAADPAPSRGQQPRGLYFNDDPWATQTLYAVPATSGSLTIWESSQATYNTATPTLYSTVLSTVTSTVTVMSTVTNTGNLVWLDGLRYRADRRLVMMQSVAERDMASPPILRDGAELAALAARSDQQMAAVSQVAQRYREQHRLRSERDQRARRRARGLLLSLLDAEQREMYRRERAFIVRGASGRRYRVDHATIANITPLEFAERGTEHRLCVHPMLYDHDGDGYLPIEDVLVAQLLHLRADDIALVRAANRHPGVSHAVEYVGGGRSVFAA